MDRYGQYSVGDYSVVCGAHETSADKFCVYHKSRGGK